MNSAVINIKTDPKIKAKAQKIAAQVGLSLSSVINGYLRKFIKEKQVDFYADEVPNAYLKKLLRQSEEDAKKGRVSPRFSDAKDAILWLNDPKAKYQNGDNV